MANGTWKRRLWWAIGIVVGLLVIALVGIRLRYGGGESRPDVSTEPLRPSSDLEVLVEVDFPPGNVTSSPDGRIFFNFHPFAEPRRFTDAFVFELVDGKPVPYPNAELQADLSGVLGMTADRQGRLWMIRPAGLEDRPTRLFGFDLATNELIVDHSFADGTGPFAQDLRVAPDGKTIYLADTGIFEFTPAALVVFDVDTKTERRVLEGHPSIAPQRWVMDSVTGPYKLAYGLVTFVVGVDGLAVSHDGEWLYYATMSHDTAYRIPTAALNDASLDDAQLAQRIERVGPKPLSDGIEIDGEGNLYITDVEHGGIARLGPDGELRTLVRDDSIVWADGVNLTANGELLFTDSEIPAYIDQLARPPAKERIDAIAPHRIHRLRLR